LISGDVVAAAMDETLAPRSRSGRAEAARRIARIAFAAVATGKDK